MRQGISSQVDTLRAWRFWNLSWFHLQETSWHLKMKLNREISNPKIDQFYEDALKAGALGGKLLGAGAGGYLMFYAPKQVQPNLIENLSELSYVDFNFSLYGSVAKVMGIE